MTTLRRSRRRAVRDPGVGVRRRTGVRLLAAATGLARSRTKTAALL